MPLTFETKPDRRHSVAIEEPIVPKYKIGDYVSIEYYETPQNRTPQKATGTISRVFVGAYSIQPDGFHKEITDIPESDIYPAQRPLKKK